MPMQSPSPLPEATRAKLAGMLNPLVLDLQALAMVAKKAHWNVTGPNFGELHELFDKVREKCQGQADVIAEDCRMLGFPVRGDHIDVAEGAQVTRMADTLSRGADLVAAVSARLRDVLKRISGEDPSTGLIAQVGAISASAQQHVIDVALKLEKLGWMLDAHLA